ncbi:MAG TPA: rhodanese-like domain-containing protein [Thermoanaerobaculia bacterium]|nr:rhodanese-like domain-containing protein [Thermoanaerobaculia bacterium]
MEMSRSRSSMEGELEPATEVSPEELLQMLQREEDPPLLIDVRKPWEHQFSRIDRSTLIPLDALPGRLTELEPSREIIVYCHHGIRSHAAAEYLRSLGYSARSLQGGIDLWAQRIDRDVPTY